MEQRGVVLEITGDEALVLTPSGEFRRQPISHPTPSIGDEIRLTGVTPFTKTKSRRRISPWQWVTTAAAAVLLLMLNGPGLRGFVPQTVPQDISPERNVVAVESVAKASLPATGKAVKFVTVDINPSIELGLDEQDRVVLVRPLNTDGEKLIKEQRLDGLKAEEAVVQITGEAVRQGYLAPAKDNAVVIAVSGENDKLAENKKLELKLKLSTEKVLQKSNLSVDKVQTVRAPKESREKAQEMGLSVGKFAIFLEALDNGLRVSAEDLKKASISKVISEAGGNPSEVIVKAGADEDLQSKAEKFKEKIQEEIAGSKPAPKPQTKVTIEIPEGKNVTGEATSANGSGSSGTAATTPSTSGPTQPGSSGEPSSASTNQKDTPVDQNNPISTAQPKN